MPTPFERRCALYVLIPNRPRRCPDAASLASALGDRLGRLHVVAWTEGAEPDRACVQQAATVAEQLEESTDIWPVYLELTEPDAVLPPRGGTEPVVALAAEERRRWHRAARMLAVRSQAHLALLASVDDRGRDVMHRA